MSPRTILTLVLCVVLPCFATSNAMSTPAMIRGVGTFRMMLGKDSKATKALENLAREHVLSAKALTSGAPVRATLVTKKNKVVLVEEWSREADRAAYAEANHDLEEKAAKLVSEPATCEYFPEALHICKPTDDTTLGVLVRQKTRGEAEGKVLRDAQREAYERQMVHEPGCTCCIILAGSSEDASQVRIVELWRTMEDFHFHESSEWHAKGEEKVVPLVVDMDCDFVKGYQLHY